MVWVFKEMKHRLWIIMNWKYKDMLKKSQCISKQLTLPRINEWLFHVFSRNEKNTNSSFRACKSATFSENKHKTQSPFHLHEERNPNKEEIEIWNTKYFGKFHKLYMKVEQYLKELDKKKSEENLLRNKHIFWIYTYIFIVNWKHF